MFKTSIFYAYFCQVFSVVMGVWHSWHWCEHVNNLQENRITQHSLLHSPLSHSILPGHKKGPVTDWISSHRGKTYVRQGGVSFHWPCLKALVGSFLLPALFHRSYWKENRGRRESVYFWKKYQRWVQKCVSGFLISPNQSCFAQSWQEEKTAPLLSSPCPSVPCYPTFLSACFHWDVVDKMRKTVVEKNLGSGSDPWGICEL